MPKIKRKPVRMPIKPDLWQYDKGMDRETAIREEVAKELKWNGDRSHLSCGYRAAFDLLVLLDYERKRG